MNTFINFLFVAGVIFFILNFADTLDKHEWRLNDYESRIMKLERAYHE